MGERVGMHEKQEEEGNEERKIEGKKGEEEVGGGRAKELREGKVS